MPIAARIVSAAKAARTTRRRTVTLQCGRSDQRTPGARHRPPDGRRLARSRESLSIKENPGRVTLLAERGHAFRPFGRAEVGQRQLAQLRDVVTEGSRYRPAEQSLGTGQRVRRRPAQRVEVPLDGGVQLGRRYRGGDEADLRRPGTVEDLAGEEHLGGGPRGEAGQHGRGDQRRYHADPYLRERERGVGRADPDGGRPDPAHPTRPRPAAPPRGPPAPGPPNPPPPAAPP